MIHHASNSTPDPRNTKIASTPDPRALGREVQRDGGWVYFNCRIQLVRIAMANRREEERGILMALHHPPAAPGGSRGDIGGRDGCCLGGVGERGGPAGLRSNGSEYDFTGAHRACSTPTSKLDAWGPVKSTRLRELKNQLWSVVCQVAVLGMLLLLYVAPTVYAQTDLNNYWTLAELNGGKALCHERVSALSCDRQQTSAVKMTEGREISSFADLANIKNPILDSACLWNPVVQSCEYRCNHLYQFPPFRVSEQLDSIRIEAHYVFEEFGAACTAFNIVPEQNGNKRCTICEDPNFNPPECYKKKDEYGQEISKHKDCMTKCNMLPNCTSVCTNLVKETPSYADKSEELAFMDCCIPQRRQLNGETLDVGREQCCREYQMQEGMQIHVARNVCCNVIETTLRGHTPYCASEICHFRLMEENITNGRDVWVEETLKEAMQYDCFGGLCGILGIVTMTSDGQMGGAMENNLISATDPPLRSASFFDIVLRELPFNAPLTGTRFVF